VDDPQPVGGGMDAGQELLGGQGGPAEHGHDLVARRQPLGRITAYHQRSGKPAVLGHPGRDDHDVDVLVDDGRQPHQGAFGQAGPDAEGEHLVLVGDADDDDGGRPPAPRDDRRGVLGEIDLVRSLDGHHLRAGHRTRFPWATRASLEDKHTTARSK
jgi:hypothetical protein